MFDCFVNSLIFSHASFPDKLSIRVFGQNIVSFADSNQTPFCVSKGMLGIENDE